MRAPLAVLPLLLFSSIGCRRNPDLRTTPAEGPAPEVPETKVAPEITPEPSLEAEGKLPPLGDEVLWDRWIYMDPALAKGYLEGEPCPPLAEVLLRVVREKIAPLNAEELAAWQATRLFALESDTETGRKAPPKGQEGSGQAEIPPPLVGVCLYERDPAVARSGPSLDEQFIASTRDGGFGPDRAIARMSADVQGAVAADLADRFRSRTFTLGTPKKPFRQAQLALLDTAPTSGPGSTGAAATNNSKHGWTMASLAHGLLCPVKGTCAATVHTRLAMPLVWDAATGTESWDLVHGGYYGSTAWLAQAIRSEVIRGGQQGPQVLALPLGWLPLRFREGPDTEVVKQALIDARCQGSLVVAAAGNRSGKQPYTQGAILPAAWADLAYGKDWDCARYPGSPAITPGEPLVFAAGALDARGTPSALTRPGSVPHLLAYGEHATIAPAVDGPPVLSGTSISTVVLASAAAVVWANDPGLSAGGVMKALYDRAEPLTPAALEVGPAGWGAEPRALKACEAFAGGVISCSTDPSTATSTGGPGIAAVADLEETFHDWFVTGGPLDVPATDEISFTTVETIDGCRVRCPSHGVVSMPGFVACPQQSLCSVMCEPRIAPQPPTDWCPTCPLSADGKLVLQTIDTGLSRNVVLEVFDQGTLVDVYHLGNITTPKVVWVHPEPPDQFQHIDKALLHRTRIENNRQVVDTSVAILSNP